ncbi:MAG: hypothetical protein ABI293_05640 [Rhodanobacter sp.]
MIEHAARRLAQRYEMRNVIDLIGCLVTSPPGSGRWRRRLLAQGSGEPTRLICPSLIAAAFQSVPDPILHILERDCRKLDRTAAARREILHIHSSGLFGPRDFDNSPYSPIIKPMMEPGFDRHHPHGATSTVVQSPSPTAPAQPPPPS